MRPATWPERRYGGCAVRAVRRAWPVCAGRHRTRAGLLTGLAEVAGAAEPQLAIRDGQLLAARLTRLNRLPATDAPASGPDTAGSPGAAGGAGLAGGTVLVSGETGMLDGLVAGHLAVRYQVRELVLVSRHGPAEAGAAQLAARLTAAGAGVRIVVGDVGDRGDAAGLVEWAAGEGGLAAVVHLAGTVADDTTRTFDVQALASKTDGAWHLHEATAGMNLAAFVTLSSAAGVLGRPGQGSDAAASTFLDTLAGWRQRQGLPALSLAWAVTGQLAEAALARIRPAGMNPVEPGPRPGTARRGTGRGTPGGARSQDRHRGAGRPGPHQPAARVAARPGPRPGPHRAGPAGTVRRTGRPAGRAGGRRPSAAGPSARPGPGRRRPGSRGPARHRPRYTLPRPRLRLGYRRRPPQPAVGNHRSAAPRHAHLRLPRTHRTGRPPPGPGGPRRADAGTGGTRQGVRRGRGTGGGGGSGVQVPGWCRVGGGAVGAGRGRPRCGGRVPGGPGLGCGGAVRSGPGGRGEGVRAGGRVLV